MGRKKQLGKIKVRKDLLYSGNYRKKAMVNTTRFDPFFNAINAT